MLIELKHAIRRSVFRKPYLYLKYLLKEVPEFPKHADIELTNICNLKCIMCPRERMTRKQGRMSFELFRKLFNEAGQYGLKDTWLHMYGDPLLHPDFFTLIEYAREKSPVTHLGVSTNCMLLDEERAKKMLKCGIDFVIFALDGVKKETYESIRILGDFEKVEGNILRFLELRREEQGPTPRVRLQIIKMEKTEKEWEAFKAKWAPLMREDDEVILKNFDTFANQVNADYNQAGESYRRKTPCPKPWESVAILWDGRVSLCCYDMNCDKFVGNLNEKSLREIWTGAAIQRERRMHRSVSFENDRVCGPCPYQDEM
ncbi:MAG: radical SAM protein [bacterium]